MKKYTLSLLALSSVLTTACVTAQDCDPSKESFYTNAACVLTGKYQDRIDQKERNLEALKEEKAKLEAIRVSLTNEQNLLSDNISQRNKALDNLYTQINAIDQSINQKNLMSSDLNKKLSDLKKQINDLKTTNTNDASKSILQKQQEIKASRTNVF